MATDHDHQTTQAEPTSTREREVIVTNNGNDGGSNGVATMLMAIVGILVVVLVGWFAIQAITGSDGEMDIPTEFDVNVNDGDAPAPGGDGGQ